MFFLRCQRPWRQDGWSNPHRVLSPWHVALRSPVWPMATLVDCQTRSEKESYDSKVHNHPNTNTRRIAQCKLTRYPEPSDAAHHHKFSHQREPPTPIPGSGTRFTNSPSPHTRGSGKAPNETAPTKRPHLPDSPLQEDSHTLHSAHPERYYHQPLHEDGPHRHPSTKDR